jgi:hypothetical protein
MDAANVNWADNIGKSLAARSFVSEFAASCTAVFTPYKFKSNLRYGLSNCYVPLPEEGFPRSRLANWPGHYQWHPGELPWRFRRDPTRQTRL